MKIAVFVSGRGSNLQAILDSEYHPHLISVGYVFGDKPECGAFSIAEEADILHYTVSREQKDNCISYQSALEKMQADSIELIVLAGFLKLMPDFIVSSYKNRIINIHPALLPCFGGKGMYGINVHNAVFESGAKISGPTIHYVDEVYDRGMIIAQTPVDISQAHTPQEIAALVLSAEHTILPKTIAAIAQGRIYIKNGRVYHHRD